VPLGEFIHFGGCIRHLLHFNSEHTKTSAEINVLQHLRPLLQNLPNEVFDKILKGLVVSLLVNSFFILAPDCLYLPQVILKQREYQN